MNRYSRQIILPQIGVDGQKAIRESKILLIGAGGLGLPCAQSLVAAGVGQLTILDDDLIELSNLQRQILFCEGDVGKNKALTAALRLKEQNSDVIVEGIKENLNSFNARNYISAHDIVIDGSDNFSTKFLINDACLLERKPWVYGSVSRFEGQIALFNGNSKSCYRCLYERPPRIKIENCAEQGILGAVTGIVANYQTLEALKYLISLQGKNNISSQVGVLHVFDFMTLEQRNLLISKRENCLCANPDHIELRYDPAVCETNFRRTWSEFTNDMNQKILFDVRTPKEFQGGHHSEGRMWQDEYTGHINSIGQVYLYCLSGARAKQKCIELRKRGISAFYIGEYRDFSLPLDQPSDRFTTFCADSR